MTTKYLTKSIDRIQALVERGKQIESAEHRAELAARDRDVYPQLTGELSALLTILVAGEVVLLKHHAESLAAMEREHQRWLTILDNLDLQLDERELAALELMGTDTEYRHYRDELRDSVFDRIRDVIESEADYERENAIEKLAVSGFALDDDSEEWIREGDRVAIEYIPQPKHTSGYTTYRWTLTRASGEVESGQTGDFARLLELFGANAAQTTEVK